jgi:excisionase family DNA binding protein
MQIHYSPDAEAEVEHRLPLLLTVPQVAGQLGIGRSSVYRLIDAGTLPTVAIGRARRVTRAALLAYVEGLES